MSIVSLLLRKWMNSTKKRYSHYLKNKLIFQNQMKKASRFSRAVFEDSFIVKLVRKNFKYHCMFIFEKKKFP